MKIYLAGPMDGESNHDGNPRPIAQWRREIMLRVSIEREWLCPEILGEGSHGQMLNTESGNYLGSMNIPGGCLEMVGDSDCVLAYIDNPIRIGTFCELAVAHVLNKPDYVAVLDPSCDDDTMDCSAVAPWFICGLTNWSAFKTEAECITHLIDCIGGEDINYRDYIQSPAWRVKATEAKERAGWRCQVCNKSKDETYLDAHHRTYERIGREKPEDITVLCRVCHGKFHGKN